MAEHILQPDHANQLVEYVRFLRRKREQCVSEVVAEFKEIKEMRLFEDSYAKETVEGLLDGLLAAVRTAVKKDLQASMNSTVLLFKQVLEQSEKSGVAVSTDLAATEDRNLLAAVETWESGMTTSSAAVPQLRARAANMKPAAVALAPVGQAQDPKLLEELETQKEANAALHDKFQKLQIQCTGILKTNTEMRAQVNSLTAQNNALTSSATGTDESVAALQGQVAALEAQLAAAREAPPVAHSGVDSLMSELQQAQARVSELASSLEDAQAEIAARVEKTKQFANMRQMLAKKNAVVKGLRDQLTANGIPVTGDVAAVDDD
mmetsp:Transcript_44147/g.73264  ORF Transcript_44147/g.73264 Transcript_44147/m.73264 type:complete len:321 (-) Transcript_44147:495-1457(-)